MGIGIIQRLPRHLIDCIAAGEVVERPASVVKELVENAIDAGAGQVDVRLNEGGLLGIEVIDNGCGMTADDAALAIEAHTTSKLRSPADLEAIGTLGFRGEALASIAAVSKLTLVTRQASAAAGTRVAAQGDAPVHSEPAGCPVGTRVVVEDLFFNTPARRKFLRAPAAEQARVLQTLRHLAVSRDLPALRLYAADRCLLDAPAGQGATQLARARSVMPRTLALFPFEGRSGDIRVHGFLSAPTDARRDSKSLWFSINGRSVRDAMLQRAVMDAYGACVEHGRYPALVLRLEMPLGAVDVNVHPQKLEVRFADAPTVYRAVAAAIASVVARAPWADDSRSSELSLGEVRRQLGYAGEGRNPRDGEQAAWIPAFAGMTSPLGHAGHSDRAPIAQLSESGFFARHQPVWTHHRFVLAHADGQLLLIDRDRARDLACEHALNVGLQLGSLSQRELMLPPTLTIDGPAMTRAEQASPVLERWGYVLACVGPHQALLRSVPAVVGEATANLVAAALQALLMRSAPTDDSLGELTRRHATSAALGIEDERALLLRLDALAKHGVALDTCYRFIETEHLETIFVNARGGS